PPLREVVPGARWVGEARGEVVREAEPRLVALVPSEDATARRAGHDVLALDVARPATGRDLEVRGPPSGPRLLAVDDRGRRSAARRAEPAAKIPSRDPARAGRGGSSRSRTRADRHRCGDQPGQGEPPREREGALARDPSPMHEPAVSMLRSGNRGP